MQLKQALAAITLFGQLAAAVSGHQKNFTHDEKHFLLDGQPYQILGGQMDPQRVPQEYWRQRLQLARSMGLNTIFSYVYWNNLERQPGEWNFEDRNDIALFSRMVQEEGLHMVLRPGPYVCAEHEWGGFPSWLGEIPGMAVRQNNKPFLNATRKYTERLSKELRDQQVTRGGPILMVQLENEYGSFVAQSNGDIDPSDKSYLKAFAQILRDNYELMLYTNDGDNDDLLRGGVLHGVLAEVDGNTQNGFAALDRLNDTTMRGPKMNGELYVTWLDHWGDTVRRGGSELNLTALTQDIEYILSTGNSFNLFMFHGGTNWGYDNGANRAAFNETLQPQITSYDYGAVLDESGRPTETFHALRKVIMSKRPGDAIPPVPQTPSRIQIPSFQMKPAAALFKADEYSHKQSGRTPVTMESLDQSYGYVLYEHKVKNDAQGVLKAGDMPRDRMIVYINGQRKGIVDATYYPPQNVTLKVQKGDTLHLFVENLGRVNFQYPTMLEQRKGIVGDVIIGDSSPLENWMSYSMPLEELSHKLGKKYDVKALDGPVFYTGSFMLPKGASIGLASDTFLAFPNGIKGQVWINGNLLGRYWTRGWQQSLYVPGAWLNNDGKANDVIALELEPSSDLDMKAVGVAKREWFLGTDPDAP